MATVQQLGWTRRNDIIGKRYRALTTLDVRTRIGKPDNEV